MMKEKTTSTFVLAVVIAIGLALVAQYGIHPEFVLAKSSSDKSSSEKAAFESCIHSSIRGGRGAGNPLQLSQSDVMNCYNQVFPNATGTSNSTTPAANATSH